MSIPVGKFHEYLITLRSSLNEDLGTVAQVYVKTDPFGVIIEIQGQNNLSADMKEVTPVPDATGESGVTAQAESGEIPELSRSPEEISKLQRKLDGVKIRGPEYRPEEPCDICAGRKPGYNYEHRMSHLKTITIRPRGAVKEFRTTQARLCENCIKFYVEGKLTTKSGHNCRDHPFCGCECGTNYGSGDDEE